MRETGAQGVHRPLGAARVGERDGYEVVLVLAVGGRAEQVGEPAAEHAQPPPGRRGNLHRVRRPGSVQLDQPAALAVRRLGERVRQRGAAVPQVRGDGLLAVQVAEGDIAEPGEQLRRHLAHAADGDVALGFAGRSPTDPAVRHDDTALDAAGVGVGADAGDRVPEHPGVPAGDPLVAALSVLAAAGSVLAATAWGQFAADRVRLQVRHPVHGHRPVSVLKHDRPGQRAGPGAQVHARLLQQAAAEPEPTRRVMVAADQHDARAGVVQPEQGILAQFDGVHRRYGAVVDVPGDQDRVHLLRAGHVHQVIEEC